MQANFNLIFSLLIFLLGCHSTFAVEPFPKSAGAAYRNLPNVPKGGTLYTRVQSNPKALNPLLTNDDEFKNVLKYLFAPMMEKDYETGEYFPALCEKVDVSKDYKIYTFTIRKGATWEDGSPITSDDAEFTYQKLWDEKVEAAHFRAYIGPFKFEKVDAQTFKFIVDGPNVNTLDNFNDDFRIIQKKQFEGAPDFNKAKGIIAPVTSGPYRLKTFSRDQKLELERKKDWWGYKVTEFKHLYNFDSIVIRIVPDTALAYEKFIKGEIDVLEMNSEMFGTRVKGSDKDKFGKGPQSGKSVWAEHFKTSAPAPFTFVGWNQVRPMFQSKLTRQALGHLIDYDQIIEKVYHGEGSRCASPFGTYTPNADPDQLKRAVKFDVAKAIKMLKKDGWSDASGSNVLSKTIDGKPVKFEFTLRYNSENPMRAKVAQIVKENFKKAGIVVNVQAMEWNTYVSEIHEHNFDAIVFGWAGGNIKADANQIWHTNSWKDKGSNFVKYSNPEADKLIDRTMSEMNVKKRFDLIKKIGAIIYDDQPYAFIVEIPGFMMGAQSRIKSKKWAMKYSDHAPLWQYYGQ